METSGTAGATGAAGAIGSAGAAGKGERVLARDAGNYIGEDIVLEGWVHNVRSLGGLSFLLLRDRTGVIQCVGDAAGHAAEIDRLPTESVVRVYGRVRADSRAPGGVEVEVAGTEVINASIENVPFEINKNGINAGLDVQLDNRVISLRHATAQAIFRVEAEIVRIFREYLRSQGFIEVFTPKIVASGTEGGSALFPVDYFGRRAFLAQSPQFYKQMAVGAGFERVFEVGHAYRAEEHNTSRHLNEYVSLDLEMGFIKDEGDVMDVEEGFIRSLLSELERTRKADFDTCGAKIPVLPPEARIPRLRFSEVVAILKDEYGLDLSRRTDLDPEGERLICSYCAEKLGSEFVFVTHFPRSARPMYTMPDENDPKLSRSFDLLFRGLEVTTGGQRIHKYDMLVESIKARGLNPATFEHYLKAFTHGMPPHGGLAIGLERITARLLGLGNVREASLFPRDRDRLTP
ncbi:MAG TPA: aspartate--tRNA(Asn) ligase [Firmicutes bacterium]|nr:aspartate--tRNA(Asn) ligase [Bacillota bacterium]